MELVWATQDFTILGQADPGFPILLWPFDGELRPGQSLHAGVFAARRARIQAVMAQHRASHVRLFQLFGSA